MTLSEQISIAIPAQKRSHGLEVMVIFGSSSRVHFSAEIKGMSAVTR
jgi:hypothetical protein